jgi:peptidoglycan/LPS O-acetylase OafA/YrhL
MTNKIAGIELLRFFAALAVVAVHIPGVGVGGFGVDIFFVISGFVMMLSTSNDANQFLQKRIIRIVPLYWLATICVFGFALVAPNFSRNTDPSINDLARSLLFIPFVKNGAGHQPLLGVGWTLNYEMYFYVFFALSCSFLRLRGLISVAFITLNMFVLSNFDNFVCQVYSDLIVLEFGLGVALYLMLNKDIIQALATICIIIIAAIVNFNVDHRFFVFGLPSFLIVFIAASYKRHLPYSHVISLLGGASYALYLYHSYIIRIFYRLLGIDYFTLPIIAATLISSICVSIVIYKYIDKPITEYLRHMLINK